MTPEKLAVSLAKAVQSKYDVTLGACARGLVEALCEAHRQRHVVKLPAPKKWKDRTGKKGSFKVTVEWSSESSELTESDFDSIAMSLLREDSPHLIQLDLSGVFSGLQISLIATGTSALTADSYTQIIRMLELRRAEQIRRETSFIEAYRNSLNEAGG